MNVLCFLKKTIATSLLGGLLLLSCLPATNENKSETKVYETHKQRIVNGSSDLAHPAVGALLYQNNIYCTGTLIAPRLILTAGHCVVKKEKKVRFRIDIPTGVKTFRSALYEVDKQLSQTHPQFEINGVIVRNDIGILVLKKAIFEITPLSFYRKKIDTSWLEKEVLTMGYGRLSVAAFYAASQKYSIIQKIVSIEPKHTLNHKTQTNVIELIGKQQSTCQGDSGGPSLIKEGSKVYTIGVSSNTFSPSCNDSIFVFMAEPYSKWISEFIDKYSTCNGNNGNCGACGTCENNFCKKTEDSLPALSCHVCKTDKDCGDGRCIRLKHGMRCVQPCHSKGKTEGCCPNLFQCTKIQGEKNSYCIPASLTCAVPKCNRDEDCSSLEHCNAGACELLFPDKVQKTCHPCSHDKDCGGNGTCYKANGLAGECLYPCEEKTDNCPKNFRCSTLFTGLRRCQPIDKVCRIDCNQTKLCPAGFTCKSNTCKREEGAQEGESCAPDVPCKKGLFCQKNITGARCYKPCRVLPGNRGGICLPGKLCNKGLNCLGTRGGDNYCLEPCVNGSCSKGGKCLIKLNLCGACDEDQDCLAGQECVKRELSLTGGHCLPKKEKLCPDKYVCTPNNACIPKKGSREVWQYCGLLNPCKQGLNCIEGLNQCMKQCKNDNDCPNQSICSGSGEQKFCTCKTSKQCPKGHICQVSKETKYSFGTCLEVPQGEGCPPEGCPLGSHCNRGVCVSLHANKEPNKEPNERRTEPDTSNQEPKGDAGGTAEKKPTTPEANPEISGKKGCACSSSSGQDFQHIPIGFFCIIIFLALGVRKRT